MAERSRSFADQSTTGVEISGAPRAGLGDLYHALLRLPWSVTIGGIALVFVVINTIYGVLYAVTDGIANTQGKSLGQAFFFSVQTFGTIGYGTMYPKNGIANVLMTLESLTSITVISLITGVVFSKFSIPKARIRFSKDAVVHDVDGVPTLSLRLANERANYVVEATVRLVVIKREATKEGGFMFRMRDLELARDRSPALTRSWVVMHPITEKSPLYGMTSQDLTDSEAQIVATVMGIDSTSSQTIHGQLVYDDVDIKFGYRHKDLLIPLGDGRYRAEYARFDETEPVVKRA